MKTKCYALYCSKHPKYANRAALLKADKIITGFRGDISIPDSHPHGADVECLEVETQADSYVEIDDFEWPITAYADGYAHTYAEEAGIELHGSCGSEDYEGKRG